MKTSTKIIIGVAAAAVLAFAFWYGGSAPGMHGWNAGSAEEAQEQPVSPLPEGVSAETVPPVEDPPAEQTEVTPPEEPVSAEAEEPAESTDPATAEGPQNPVTPGPQEGPAEPEPAPAAEEAPPQTDPVTEGNPAPVDPQNVTVTDVAHTCTISISCNTILDHMDWLDPEKTDLVPAGGVILAPVTVTFYEGESVFNVLQRTCRQNGIHMEFENTPMYNSAYIEGIANLYEFDCGELSGWMYSVNGWFPNYGCSRYALQEGDIIRWLYTCDLGADVGGGYAAGSY